MAIYPHSSPHLQIRPSLIHPFLRQYLDIPCNARASCQYSYNMYIIVKVHIHRPRLMQTQQIFITFRTFIGQKIKETRPETYSTAATDVLHLQSLCMGAGFKTREVKVRSPAMKSRTRETDRLVGTPCPAASHALLILGGVPDLGGAGRWCWEM